MVEFGIYKQSTLNQLHTRDPWGGTRWRPATLHGFSYVQNNPINGTDPTGFCRDSIEDESCWSVYEHIIKLCPECALISRLDVYDGSSRLLQDENIHYLRVVYEKVRAGWRPSDPLTDQQWLIVKQEASRFGLPKELVGATIAAEVVYDTDWVNNVYDLSTRVTGMLADFAYSTRDWPLFNACYNVLEGFHEYFGLAEVLELRGIGYGMAPGIANVHAGPAVRAETYINETYPGQGLLPDLGIENQNGNRLRMLLSDEGSIRYAAAYLRWRADQRTGTTTAHKNDLSDTDMIIIYTAYRCDIQYCYGDVQEYQNTQLPNPFGHPNDFSEFLPVYKTKP